ncbi:ribose-phosphate diphosphokinase [Halalkalibacter lacteus]|uniref:ribose-phosphate diphosphokinase n=1 Tax=Halalkalibacter lacteus TaxID=3090663 RepID=UPI002FC9ACE1
MGNSRLDSNVKVFSLNSNVPLAKEIVEFLGVDLGESSVTKFSDGEIQINIEESVRGCEVYLIQSTSQPGNQYIMELLTMIDAMKRASAESINVVIPYYGYARQDRKARSREPITSKLIANLLEVAGATRILSLDLHSPQIQGFFDIPVDQLVGVPLLAKYFNEKELDDIVVVAPDNGGVVRARKFASLLHAPIAFIDKRRPMPNVVEVMNVVGEIKGKRAIIIDDMIDTAGTISLAANSLMEKDALEVYACCTHPVLSGPAVERLKNSEIKELVTTNSIDLSDEKRMEKLTILSVAPLIAQAIIRIHKNESVSVLFE